MANRISPQNSGYSHPPLENEKPTGQCARNVMTANSMAAAAAMKRVNSPRMISTAPIVSMKNTT